MSIPIYKYLSLTVNRDNLKIKQTGFNRNAIFGNKGPGVIKNK